MENTELKTTPRDFFLNLMHFVLLYTSVVSVLVLFFQYVNVLFPDPLVYFNNTFDMVRAASSVLIIAFPTFLIIVRMLGHDFRLQPEKHKLAIRRWLTYLTLFVAGATMIIVLIMLVHGFYGGDLTSRFALKAISVFIVAGMVFRYYLRDARSSGEMISSTSRMYGWISTTLVFAILVSGFFVVGSPAKQRDLKFDQERVNDLRNIESFVVSYWQTNDTLPDALVQTDANFESISDPETNVEYSYTKTSDLTFTLCAVFNQNSDQLNTFELEDYLFPGKNFRHQEGETCFYRTIKSELFDDGKIIPVPAVRVID